MTLDPSTDHGQSRRGRLILWFDDEPEVFDRIRRSIISKVARIECHVFPSLHAFKGVAQDVVRVSRREPFVAFVICREVPTPESLRVMFDEIPLKGVVSDLQIGGDALAGLTILSAAASSRSRPELALFSSSIDVSVERLAKGIGVKHFVLKRDDSSLRPLIYDWLDLRGYENSRRASHMEAELNSVRRQCQKLQREKRALKKQLEASSANKPPGTKKILNAKAESDANNQVEKAQQIIQMVLSHNHDLSNTSSLTLKTIEQLCADVKLVPPVLLPDLERARITAKHSDILVQSLASISGNEKNIRSEPSSVRQAAKDVCEILERKIPKAITVETQIPDRLPLCSIPAHLLVRIFLNLLLNALEAMPKGGTISIIARIARSKQKQITLQVRDSGLGIKKADLPKVCSHDFSTKGKRQGFGLFIVRRILADYKGTISLRSERGKGTSVTLNLPTT